MNVELDLKHHCIETALKRRHNSAISLYFKTDGGKNDLEDEIALLAQALRVFDFQLLRSRWPELSGGSGHRIILARDAAGEPGIRFDDTVIIPPANLRSPAPLPGN